MCYYEVKNNLRYTYDLYLVFSNVIKIKICINNNLIIYQKVQIVVHIMKQTTNHSRQVYYMGRFVFFK